MAALAEGPAELLFGGLCGRGGGQFVNKADNVVVSSVTSSAEEVTLDTLITTSPALFTNCPATPTPSPPTKEQLGGAFG